ncbi:MULTISPECIES: hypothetical protein [unclassified Mycobacterium]|uniref:hypothetical protein n=1 Tax=unclassified Mycobacterium TaxID=2642494 RepID=UPI0029C72455|nr:MULTISPECIES: hypothetical protein [unclassified Mycobacterium]
MKTTTLGVALAATAAAFAMLVPATAHADDGRVKFSSPSGNIRCVLEEEGEAPIALCQLDQITYTVPPGVGRGQTGEPCPGTSGSGNDVRLDVGKPGFVRCSYAALDGGVGPWPTLAYGRSQSMGVITCDSAPTAVTCTDTSSGHYFRVSRDLYELG